MPAKSTLDKTLDLAAQFVRKHGGKWDHAQWELFLADAAALGHELTDEARRHLGNLLEAVKHLHAGDAPKPAPKAPASKAKPAAKPKAAPK